MCNSRRRATALVGILILGMLGAGCASGDDSASAASSEQVLDGEVIWADYGGPTNEARYAAFFDEFAQETGVEVTSVPVAGTAVNEMLAGNPGDYDTFQAGAINIYKYKDSLVELPANVPRSESLPNEIRDYAFGAFYITYAQGWLDDTYPDGGPQDWVDFFDTETYPGVRAWQGNPSSYNSSFEIALLADGVAPEDLYPLDLERATAKLDEIRDHLVFYQSYPEVQQLLVSGSAQIAVTVTGQFTALRNAGEDVVVQWNDAFVTFNAFVIPQHATNRANLEALAAFMADGKREAIFTERTEYGPAYEETQGFLDATTLEALPNSDVHVDQTLMVDEEYRATIEPELLDAYTAWLAK